MIPALAPIFPGPFAAIAEPLVLADDPRPYIGGAELLNDNTLRELLAGFASNYSEPEALAVATQWSKWHLSIFLAPVVAANILADWALPTAIEDVGVILSADKRTLAIRLADGGKRARYEGPQQRFAPLMRNHLAPLFLAVSQASGLPAKVLWSNAGNVFENVVARCAEGCGENHPGIADARALLGSRTDPDGRKNPLFEPVRYSGRGGSRQRRVCCLRYRMASLPLCKSCPLDRVPARPARMKTDLRAGP